MTKSVMVVVLGLITCAVHAEELDDSENFLYLSVGFDAYAKTKATLKILDYKIHENMKYNYDAPIVSFGIDYYGNVIGLNLSRREDYGFRIQNITSVIEMPFLPFDGTPYGIIELGFSDIKFDDAGVHLHDCGFVYGGGVGMRINVSDNTFIKTYVTWSYVRFHDDIDDIPIRMSVMHRRIGAAVGFTF